MRRVTISVFILTVFMAIVFLYVYASNTTQSDLHDHKDLSLSDLRELEESYLKFAIAPELLPYAHLEVSTIDNVATSSPTTDPFLDLSLFPDQPLKNGGVRSEVSIDYPYQESDIVEYTWQFRIPKNFESDAPDNRWWILADWHDQPDLKLGETWESYESGSTPIIFGYGFDQGRDVVSLSTGSRNTAEGVEFRGLIPISREVWHTIRMVVKWSQTDSGRVTVYFDDATTPTFDIAGENMVNGYQHYMKIGQYRHPDIQATSTISIKNISISTVGRSSDDIEEPAYTGS